MYCHNNLIQLALGLHNYHDSYQNLPAGVATVPETPQIPIAGPQLASSNDVNVSRAPWTVRVLPYIEMQAMYDQFDVNLPVMGFWRYRPNNQNLNAGLQRNIRFECPSDPNALPENATNNYFGVQGGCTPFTGFWYSPNAEGCMMADSYYRGYLSVNGPLSINDHKPLTRISDGTSNTILLAESVYNPVKTAVVGPPSGVYWMTWASGINIAWNTGNNAAPDGKKYRYKVPLVALTYQPNVSVLPELPSNRSLGDYMTYNVGSFHSGGINVAYCDGSVHFISDSISPTVFRSAGSVYDGGPLGGIN